MSEQDKQQLGDGSTNYADAAQKTAKAIKEAGNAAAEKTAGAAGEATANTTAAVAQAGVVDVRMPLQCFADHAGGVG